MIAKALPPLLVLMLAAAAPAQAGEMTLDCLAGPAQRVALGASVTGLLSDVLVGRGDHVTKGEVLAKLDATVEEANVEVAKAQAEGTEMADAQRTRLQVAQAEVDRAEKLSKSGSMPQSQLEQLEATARIAQSDLDTELRKLQLARIELDRQQALLELQSIKSPVDGFVIEQNLHVGEFVRQDSPIMTLVQSDPLYVDAYAPVALWGKITADSHGTVLLDQPANTRLDAKVTVVDPVFDAASGTFGVRLELKNPDEKIPAGQRCQVVFNVPDP